MRLADYRSVRDVFSRVAIRVVMTGSNDGRDQIVLRPINDPDPPLVLSLFAVTLRSFLSIRH